MHELEKILALVAAGETEKAIERLRNWLQIHSPDEVAYCDQVSGGFKTAKEAHLKKLIDFSEYTRNKALADYAVQEKVMECLKSRQHSQIPLEKNAQIPDFHAFSCDRVEQTDQFQLAFYQGITGEKIRHFYLYGDARQSHESLHERLGRELCGHLLDWESGNYEPPGKILFQRLKPAVHRHPMLYKIEVVKNIFARFFPKMSGKEPVQQKNTADLLDSPLLEGYGPNDMVFTLITMDDANWNKEVTPLAVEAFIEGFLNVELPENAPTFFFFFGLEYQKDNPNKRQEVHEAIQNRKFGGEVLDELQPVSSDDITEWFSRYRKIMVERGKEPREMMEACFGQVKMIDMKDIEIKLLELIRRHNRGLAITADALKRQT